MPAASAPLRRLGAELRRLREAQGRTQGDVGAAIGRTHATLVNWEHGKTKISKSDLACLLAELGAPADLVTSLENLRAEVGRSGGPWAVYRLPERLKPLVSFEQDAVKIMSFEPILIPGLLQTEDYARAIHLAGHRVVTAEQVQRWVGARMQRQRRLFEAGTFILHAVVGEAALRLLVGGARTMSRQIERLVTLADNPNVTVQVLPTSNDGGVGVASNFTILHFANSETDPPLGYFDGPLGGTMVSEARDVTSLMGMFDDLCAAALSEDESVDLLRTVLRQQREEGDRYA